MKDVYPEKEGLKQNFDYNELWEEENKEQIHKNISELTRGLPRKGIKGRYIKPKGYISKRQIKLSYCRGLKEIRDSEK